MSPEHHALWLYKLLKLRILSSLIAIADKPNQQSPHDYQTITTLCYLRHGTWSLRHNGRAQTQASSEAEIAYPLCDKNTSLKQVPLRRRFKDNTQLPRSQIVG